MTRTSTKNRNQSVPKFKKETLKDSISNETCIENIRPWTPSGMTAFKALLSACLCSAVWSNISDCDETFNYWEPAHYLIYGEGYQTWEYSPKFALRSYAYLLLYVLPGKLYQLLIPSNKIFMFYFIRFLMALCCAGSEAAFYRAICMQFGTNIGRLTLLFLVLSSGMFISCTSFLPSTFAMYLTMLSYAAWFQKKYNFAIMGIAVGSLFGWPFAVVLGIPVALDIIFIKKKWLYFLRWSIISLFFMVPLVSIDSNYYGKIIIAPLNIIFYNIFTSHGPNLYGEEHWSFYFLNGFLNFNIVFIASLVSLPIFVLLQFLLPPIWKFNAFLHQFLALSAFYIWLIIFTLQPHKEERFLFPIYPLICLSGAVTLDSLQKIYFHLCDKLKTSHYLYFSNCIAVGFCVVFTLFSLSRSIGTYKAYRAPLEIYIEMTRVSQELGGPQDVNVCSGKEWHRFPSSFFLPYRWKHNFIKSEFQGQLPQPFSPFSNGTQIIPENMNDLNQEEPSIYASINDCDFLIDSDFPVETKYEPRYALKIKEWSKVLTIPFLDAQRSPQLLRSFYIPFLTEWYCTYVDYNLLKYVKPKAFKKKSQHLKKI